jgi:transposase
VRVCTAFNRLLRLPGASVADVSFTDDGVVVTVRLRRRRRVCGRCGQTGALEIHDRRVKRWRHLDLGASRCIIECELRRLRCSDCGVRAEAVPWARPGAAHTRDFEDLVAWLAQQMAFAPIARLLRIGWHTIGPIVARVVADVLDERRLDALVWIGVDEISYRRHHRYLTSVADHRRGAIVWCSPGRNSATLQRFFDALGDRKQSIRAVSIDMSGDYQRAIRQAVPDAEICFDPFHVVRLAARATDQVRRDEWNAHDRSHTPRGRWVKGTRWSLLKAPANQSIYQLATLAEVQRENRRLYRAFLLREELRLLYHLDDPGAGARAPRRLARVGHTVTATAVRPARAHPAQAPRRHPRRHRTGPLQRPPRRSQQQDPPDQPPRLWLSLRRPADRARLPLLRRHHDRPTAMTSPPNRAKRLSWTCSLPSGQGMKVSQDRAVSLVSIWHRSDPLCPLTVSSGGVSRTVSRALRVSLPDPPSRVLRPRDSVSVSAPANLGGCRCRRGRTRSCRRRWCRCRRCRASGRCRRPR